MQKYNWIIALLWICVGQTLFAQTPTELPEYNVAVHKSDVVVYWAYPCGLNIGFFVVERSKDLVTIDSLAHLEYFCRSEGDLSVYNFKDTRPYQGISYYRVKQYSAIYHEFYYENWEKIVFDYEKEGLYLKAYPNPLTADQSLKVEWETTTVQPVSIDLILLDGRVHTLLPSTSYLPGIYSNNFDLNQFPQGIYFLKLKVGEVRKTWKVIKL